MASYLQIENISKSYGPKVLFENIGFNINEGDKIALIAPNGTGKTSLMRILAGKDKSDSGGKIMFLKDIRIAFLEQEYPFDPEKSIFDQIISSSEEFTKGLDQEHLWEYERRIVKFLTNFNLPDPDQKMKELSGGEVKRVALSQMLASDAEFFIMDEPTNHLDIDAIEFLEGYLSRSRCTLLMVTHDRYFLDKVCNTIIEMERGAIYTYKGNYENYLEKREERIANYNAETDKVRNILRRELEWIRSTPCARTGKARYRINAFYDLKDRASQVYTSSQVNMSELKGASRLGTKIINCKDLSFYYGDDCYLDKFTYNFQRYERVGIVGRNGAGKSTFLNILTGKITGQELSGSIERGESLKIGYYHQSGMDFNPQDTVLDIVNDTWLLNRFLFPHEMLNNKVEKLSGGEKRRLYLCTVLMRNPNFLVLDEPTNDLDVETLELLEELIDSYQGTVLLVSHDRQFVDNTVTECWIFEGGGKIGRYVGGYHDARGQQEQYVALKQPAVKKTEEAAAAKAETVKRSSSKLSYKLQRELEQLPQLLEDLEAKLEALQTQVADASFFSQPHEQTQKVLADMAAAEQELEQAFERWEYLEALKNGG